jgi:hypothetical protein
MLLPRGNVDEGDQDAVDEDEDEELWAETTVATQPTTNTSRKCDFTP